MWHNLVDSNLNLIVEFSSKLIICTIKKVQEGVDKLSASLIMLDLIYSRMLLSLFFSSSFGSFHHRLTPKSVSYRLLSIFETDKIDNYDVIQHLENTQRL